MIDELGFLPSSFPGRGRFLAEILMSPFLAASVVLLAWSFGSLPLHAEAACNRTRLQITTPALASTPYVVLDVGGRRGPWLLDFGSTITSVYADAWTAPGLGGSVPLFDFGFFGAGHGPRTLPAVKGGRNRVGVGSPLGTLGTDILKTVTTEIHLEDAADPHVVFLDPSCDGAVPARERYARFGQANFFSSHPEAHVSNLPNVPVVFVELEERSTDRQRLRLPEPKRSPRTWAQVDTGYDDTYWPYAVDINEAYLAQLKDAVPSLTLAGLVPVSGCGREDTLRDVYVAPGWRLNIVPDIPQRPIPFDSFHLIVKPRSTGCGGIGPMPMPAAQLGASFLRAFGTTILAPTRAEMWVKLPGHD